MSLTHLSVKEISFIHHHIHRQIPARANYTDDAIIPFALTIAAWGSKNVQYTMDHRHEGDISVIYRIYNDDCVIVLRFNRITRFCTVDFDAIDESFDYDNFERIIDFFFSVD